MQSLGRLRRRLVITVRAAAGLGVAVAAPYVTLELGGNQEIQTAVASVGGSDPVWDEAIEFDLPPPLPHEQPLSIRAQVYSNIRFCPDRFIASGSTTLDDLVFGGAQLEKSVPLRDKAGKAAGHLHLGLLMIKEGRPGTDVGSAAGTVLGEVPGGGPGSMTAAAGPGPVLPSAGAAEMQAREVLGAGYIMDPSKPAAGLYHPPLAAA